MAAVEKRDPLRFFKSAKGIITTVVPVVGLLVTLGIVRPFGGETTDALANAAGNTVDAGSSKVTLTTEVRPKAGPRAAFSGTGAVDYRTNRGKFTFDYSATPGAESLNALPAILSPNAFYYNLSGVARTARPWLRVSPAEAAKLLGTGEAELSKALNATTDPSKVLEALKDAGDVDEKGKERLFGVTTTRYEGQLDPEKLGAGAGKADVKVWVDGSDLVRRTEFSLSDRRATVRIRQDLHDFGTEVRADPPPANEVMSLTEFQRGVGAGRR